MNTEPPGSHEPERGPQDGDVAPKANASGRQLARNVVNSYLTYFVGAVMTLVLTRVLLRHLGPAEFGLWGVLGTIVVFLGLLDAGVSTATVQRVARLTAEGDGDGVAVTIRTAWVFFGASSVIAVLVVCVLAPFLSSFLHLGTISPVVAGVALVLLGGSTAARFLTLVPQAVLFGSGRSDRLSQVGLLALVITQVSQAIVAVLGAGLVGVAACALIGGAIGLLLTAALVQRATGADLRAGHFSRPLFGELVRSGSQILVIAVSGIVSYQLDTLIIGAILPVAQVAPYSVALNTANLTTSVATQGTNLLMPTYTHFETVGDRQRQSWIFFRSVAAVLALAGPMVVALAAFGQPSLELWLGHVPAKTYSIMIALGIVTVLQLPGQQCFIYLIGIGRNRIVMIASVIGAVVNLAGSIAATFWLGPIGPAIGSLPVVLVLNFVVMPIIVCRTMEVPVGDYATSALAPVLPVLAAAGLAAWAATALVPHAHGVVALVGLGAVVAVAWAVLVVVLMIVEPDLRRSLARRLPGSSGKGDAS